MWLRQFLVSPLTVLGWIVVLFTLAIMGLLLTLTSRADATTLVSLSLRCEFWGHVAPRICPHAQSPALRFSNPAKIPVLVLRSI
jgi:hypothetical protein